MSSKTPLAIAFHLVGLLSLSHSVWQIYQPGPMSSHFDALFGGRSNYLTLWGLASSWTVFALKLFLHFKSSQPGFLEQFHAALNLIVLSVESSISFIYWSMIAFKPELMIPPGLSLAPPLSLDLALHLYPALFLWLDHLFFASPTSSSRPTLLIAFFGFLYTSWIEFSSAYGNNYQSNRPPPQYNDRLDPGEGRYSSRTVILAKV
ncbi:FAR-17a/AIG1-like protein [Melampsora americana]|nr:FAR-17a/AIG1-like protein [Melampsora americana]